MNLVELYGRGEVIVMPRTHSITGRGGGVPAEVGAGADPLLILDDGAEVGVGLLDAVVDEAEHAGWSLLEFNSY